MSIMVDGEATCQDKDALLAGLANLFGESATINESGDRIYVNIPGAYGRGVTITKRGDTWVPSWDEDDAYRIRKAAGKECGTVDGLISQAALEVQLTKQAKKNRWKVNKKQGEKGVVRLELQRTIY